MLAPYRLTHCIRSGTGDREPPGSIRARTMPLLKKKSRIVSFRVEGEEYDRLAQACLDSGARSLAEFARGAIFEKVQMLGAPRFSLNSDLTTLGKALAELDAALVETSVRIRRLLGPGDHAERSNGECR